jgi:hypothetical protein
MNKKTKKKIKKMQNAVLDNVKTGWTDFQKQRKSKKGIGGFLQRIADNQNK